MADFIHEHQRSMESTRPIRALVRGLDALTMLNLRNGATVSEIAQQIRLPRTTTYRILETLTHAGYVYRDSADDRYRLITIGDQRCVLIGQNSVDSESLRCRRRPCSAIGRT